MSNDAVIADGFAEVALYPFMNRTNELPPPDRLTEPVVNPLTVAELLDAAGAVFVPPKFPLKLRTTPDGARSTPLKIALEVTDVWIPAVLKILLPADSDMKQPKK